MNRNLLIIAAIGVAAIVAIAAVAIVLTNDNNGGFDHGNKVVDPKLSAGEINLTAEDLGEGWELNMPRLLLARVMYGSDFDNSMNRFVNESGNFVNISVQLMGSQKIANLYYSLSVETDFIQSDITFLSKCQNSLMVSLTEIDEKYDEELGWVEVEYSYTMICFQDLDAVVSIAFDIDPSDPLIDKIMSTIEKNIHENATDPPNFNHRQKNVWVDPYYLSLTAKDLGDDWELCGEEGDWDYYDRYFENESTGETVSINITNYGDLSYAMDMFAGILENISENYEITDLSKCQQSFKAPGEGDNDTIYVFQDLYIVVEIRIVSDDADALAAQIMSMLEKKIHDASQSSLMDREVS